MVRIQEVVIDCAEPAVLARFWGTLLSASWGLVSDDWAVVDADPLFVCFQRVPEAKSSPKNRLHLDIEVEDAWAACEQAEAMGATRTGAGEVGEQGNGYLVMRDPEANEFCFVVDHGSRWDAILRRALA
jgi:hypothetical protein